MRLRSHRAVTLSVVAAALLASSPPLLNQVRHAPMSDIVASTWWTLALLLVPRASRMSALLTGLAAGLAILTRPNLVPLAVVPAPIQFPPMRFYQLWSDRTHHSAGHRWFRGLLAATGQRLWKNKAARA